MHTVNASVMRQHMADVLGEVDRKKEIFVVLKNNKPISAMINLDLLEELLSLADSDYLESIKQARQEYKNGEVFSHADAFGEL